METDKIGTIQANIIQEIHPTVLNKSLNEKEEAVTVADDNAQKDLQPATPGTGENVDLFA